MLKDVFESELGTNHYDERLCQGTVLQLAFSEWKLLGPCLKTRDIVQ